MYALEALLVDKLLIWTRGLVQWGIRLLQTMSGRDPHHRRHIASMHIWALKCLSYGDLALIRLLFKHLLARDGYDQEASVHASQFLDFE